MIEQFKGRTFVGIDGENPNAPAAEILKTICVRIENIYYTIATCYTDLNFYLNRITTDTETGELDLTEINKAIGSRIGYAVDMRGTVYDLGLYLHLYDLRHNTHYYSDYYNYYSGISNKYSKVAELAGSTPYTFMGTVYDDNIVGAGTDNYLFGESGSDTLSGADGSDALYGGYGNDILRGGAGNDIYMIEKSHGNDVIYDTEGENVISFADYFDEEDYIISVSPEYGFEMKNKETHETVSVPDFLLNPSAYKFIFHGTDAVFTGGSRDTVTGNETDDNLEAGDGFNIFYGENGSDTISGGADMDFMYGGFGDDTLLGRNGINALFGDDGNDTIYDGDDSGYLSGGSGDDFYLRRRRFRCI